MSISQKPKISILTDPMPWGQEIIYEGSRRIARFIRDAFRPKRQYFNHPKYRGHFAVTRSLIEGLQNIGASFNYNPRYPWQIADTVVVLAGIRTLRQAIRLKKQGKIKKLFAGPNIVVFSSDYDSLLAAPEVDAAITPSDLVVDLYLEDNPSLTGRIFSWPAGVNSKFWTSDTAADRRDILIFEKQIKGPVGPVEPYAEYLRSLGWNVQIIKYGSFSHGQYLESLNRSCLMLGFVTDESQGIAWAEAWSADVPTLIWRNTSNVWGGRRYSCSTAPYLTPQNGLFFDDLEDFKVQFAYWEANAEQFKPRAWTLENMSDEVCASMLYKKVFEC
jgi:hypothetical protein